MKPHFVLIHGETVMRSAQIVLARAVAAVAILDTRVGSHPACVRISEVAHRVDFGALEQQIKPATKCGAHELLVELGIRLLARQQVVPEPLSPHPAACKALGLLVPFLFATVQCALVVLEREQEVRGRQLVV